MANTNATEFRNILVDMPDFPGTEVEFWLLTRFAANGTEAFPKKKYTLTLDANGLGTQALPVPSSDAWLWRVVTPDGKPPYNPTLAAGADLQLTTWLASAQSTETAASLADQFAALDTFNDHVVDTTVVHGIADTSLLETTAGAQAKADAAEAAAIAASEPDLGNPSVDGHVLSSTIAGARSWVAGGGGSGDFMADGSVPMTGNLELEGADVAGVLTRPYLEFQAQGALVEGLWRQQQVTIGPEKYDNSLRWTYNSQWNASTTNDSRLIDGEHTILYGLESRWTSGVDPTTIRGQVEWYLRISPGTTGAISNHEAFSLAYDMDNELTSISLGSNLDTNNAVILNNGRMRIIGADTVDGGYALKTENLPIWAYGGLTVSGSTLIVEGVYASGGSSSYGQWIKTQASATDGGQLGMLLISGGKFGSGALNVASAFGAWIHGNSITKGTTGSITRTSALTLTRATIGNGNAALTFGNGNDIANPGFANYNIYQINTDPNYFAGMVRAASFGAGNLAANTATPAGATAFAMPIYNASGTLQGYIPVYAAQWS